MAEGAPVNVDWRWYYNVPSWPLWVLLLLLAVVPKHNRHRQAWLILLLPLLAAGLSLFVESAVSGSDGVGQFLTALAIAWTSVWLLGPWLQRGEQVRRLLSASAVMFAVGAVGYLGFFGVWASRDVTLPTIGFWAVCSISLVAAAGLTGLCCRGNCTPLHLVFWPMLWMPVASALCVSVFAIIMVVFVEGLGSSVWETLVFVIVPAVVGSAVVAGALYVFDLPVMLLRMFSPCYRERFRGIFCSPADVIPTSDRKGKLDGESVPVNPFRT